MSRPKSTPAVTIVVPIYGDWPSLSDCLDSLLEHVPFARGHKVMLVNDCGPDVEAIEKNTLERIGDNKHFSYHRNPHNLGFVGTCNRAVLELDKSNRDILLLNSDTIVTKGFLDEMQDTMAQDDHIGAVSPRSNNATIATIPASEMITKNAKPEESYAVYKKVKDLMPKYVVTPVAHGFCMLIRRSCIKEYGLFDPIFGKGYGEETDFSMRIKSHGYITVLSNWAYVFHMEARSFSMETKSKLLEKNQLIMFKRYPLYRETVRRYVSDEQDVVDRFANLIAGYGDSKNLVDLRGLSHLSEQRQKQVLKNSKDFAKSSDKKVLYLADNELAQDPRKARLSASSIIRQSHVKETFHTAYRPFELTDPDQAFLLNRHALNIIIESSSPDLIEISDRLTSSTDPSKKINPAALRERWTYFITLENSSTKNNRHKASVRERVKDLIKSNRITHSIARRIKRVLRG